MLALICSIAVSAATVGNCRPVPDRNLLDRMRSGVDTIGIVHFSVNTFTAREWGYGSESPEDFNPTDFSADQIVGACRDGGIQGLVVVAKHHDGFCLWPTKTNGLKTRASTASTTSPQILLRRRSCWLSP